MYFSSDPAMSIADLHVLSGALAFGGTETLGAGAELLSELPRN